MFRLTQKSHVSRRKAKGAGAGSQPEYTKTYGLYLERSDKDTTPRGVEESTITTAYGDSCLPRVNHTHRLTAQAASDTRPTPGIWSIFEAEIFLLSLDRNGFRLSIISIADVLRSLQRWLAAHGRGHLILKRRS